MDRIDQLRIFIRVADSGGFTMAADQFGLPRPTVSLAIQQLEARLGARLFNRTTRAVALTEAGGRYLDQARRALAEFAALELTAAGDQAAARGTLTVTAPEMFGRLHVLPIALDFMTAHPAIEVALTLLNRIAAYVSFVEEGIDLGVRIAHRLPRDDKLAGHISVRDREDGTLLVPRVGVFWDEITANDFVRIDGDGRIVEGSGELNPTIVFGRELHKARPDIVCALPWMRAR